MIAHLGMDVIPNEAIPYNETDISDDTGIISQWSYPNRLLAAARWAGTQKNVLFIQLNSFGCGPDALLVDELNEILQQKGKISSYLRIDEVTSQGSIKLRIRSLLESVKNRGMDIDIQPQPRKKTSLFLETDRTKKIIVPDFAPGYSLFVEAVLSQMGYNVEVLPSPDRESVDWGLKYVNNEICYPAIICVGDIIKALKSGTYAAENTVAAISETGGQCRASNYAALLKKSLCRAGFENVPVVTISLSKQLLNQQPGFKIDSTRIALAGFSALLFIDILYRMYYATAAREIVPGQAKIIFDRYLLTARSYLRKYTISKSKLLLAQACQEFNAVGTRSLIPPRVGLVGEIYLKYNPFSNYFTAQWLLEQGVELIHPSLLTFFLQYFVNIEADNILNLHRSNYFKTKTVKMLESVVNQEINKSNKVLQNFRYDVLPVHPVRRIAESAEKVLSLMHQYGEGWLIAGEISTMAEAGVNNIICLQPFGCIANHVVAKGIGRKLKILYPDLNLLFIDADAGSTAVNIHNRLHFLVDNAQTEALMKDNKNIKELTAVP
jgi:predicted nucleotide-binding protein (sugar kinase/HSP70/actin superfamily)